MRNTTEPSLEMHGAETHPAWGMISVHRTSCSPGAVLFDSDIQHQHTVVVSIATASRKRDLGRDWLHPVKEFVEVEMSEAQWASFVSAFGQGSGVPCTIRRREDEFRVPGFPFTPRMKESMGEVRDAATHSVAKIRAAFAAYKEKKNVGNLRHLEAMIDNAPANMEFAAESLTKYTEGVIQRAKADIEAMVVSKARELGVASDDIAQISSGVEI